MKNSSLKYKALVAKTVGANLALVLAPALLLAVPNVSMAQTGNATLPPKKTNAVLGDVLTSDLQFDSSAKLKIAPRGVIESEVTQPGIFMVRSNRGGFYKEGDRTFLRFTSTSAARQDPACGLTLLENPKPGSVTISADIRINKLTVNANDTGYIEIKPSPIEKTEVGTSLKDSSKQGEWLTVSKNWTIPSGGKALKLYVTLNNMFGSVDIANIAIKTSAP